MQRYTDDELLNMLREKAEELSRIPKYDDVRQHSSICRRFGTWNKALKLAGFTPSDIRRRYTDEELFNVLREKAKELGRPPKMKEVRLEYVIKDQFGSWNKGIELAGLTPRNVGREGVGYTDDELLNILKEKAKELNSLPRVRDVEQATTIRNRFGSWFNALVLAGLIPEDIQIIE